jgi:hypothetical protein
MSATDQLPPDVRKAVLAAAALAQRPDAWRERRRKYLIVRNIGGLLLMGFLLLLLKLATGQ